MSLLTSEARIPFADAAGLADRMIKHLATHEIAFEERDGMMVANLSIGTSALAVETDALRIRVEAEDKGQLETLRSVIASHVVEFAGDHPLTIKWVGHEPTGETFANLREVTLKAAIDLTPHMRRLTFTGSDIDRFASDDDLHVRMYFPPEGLEDTGVAAARPRRPHPVARRGPPSGDAILHDPADRSCRARDRRGFRHPRSRRSRIGVRSSRGPWRDLRHGRPTGAQHPACPLAAACRRRDGAACDRAHPRNAAAERRGACVHRDRRSQRAASAQGAARSRCHLAAS